MAKIIVSGATGLVGAELLPLLQAGDYGVSRLVREYSAVDGGDVFWDPAAGELDTAALEDLIIPGFNMTSGIKFLLSGGGSNLLNIEKY